MSEGASVEVEDSDQAEPLPLVELTGGIPDLVTDAAALRAVTERLAAATGPVAIDAERASGYRYGQRCYLVQLYREGAGVVLVDPIECPDLSPLSDAIADVEWILHAASQDLPCMREIGLVPRHLFDTELAARLAGYERVGLAAMVEHVLGRRLDKGPSSADWSQRPLPPSLLHYAALDVQVLPELRDHLDRDLAAQGKREWAAEEFAAIVEAPPREPRGEPWRRTSGVHRLRTPRQLAAVRALWERRDAIARQRDLAPGRVLPDSAIVDAVLAWPRSPEQLAALPVFSGRANRRRVDVWLGALQEAADLPESELPRVAAVADGMVPPPHRWAERDPAAAARLVAVRTVVGDVAAAHRLRVENLLEPATVRKLAWQPPVPTDADSVAAMLRDHGAREWQVALTAVVLAAALAGADGT